MKVLALLSLIVMFSGCGGSSSSNYTTNSAFTDIQAKFNSLAVTYGRAADTSVVITFNSTTGKGQCFDQSSPKRIYINSAYWFAGSTDSYDKEQLIFHELGLCALGRPLVEDCNTSIMCRYVIDSAQYQSNYTNYINELFTVY